MTAGEGASARAVALGIPATPVDGNDVFAVHEAAGRLVAEVRAGQGPRLLHALTYRVKGHVSVDLATYRDPAELAAALETDPVARARARLRADGIEEARLVQIERESLDEVQAALDAADAAPWPEVAAAFTDVQTTGAGQWR